MKEVALVYPHQLFAYNPAITTSREVYIVEEPLLFTEFPVHKQKLLLHRLSMKAYAKALVAKKYRVTYLSVCDDIQRTADVFERLHIDGVSTVHITDVADDWLTRRITSACTAYSLEVVWHESPMFLLSKTQSVERYIASKKHMATFYKQMRIDTGILVREDGKPEGGKWSFDAENRKALPKTLTVPQDPEFYENDDVQEALAWLVSLAGDHYGTAQQWLPYTHVDAEAWLQEFLRERFINFGSYEDAISSSHTLLFHSALSPLLNIGLLTPKQVIDAALAHAQKHHIPLSSVEGFVRQLLGWREFMRAAYESEGRTMRTKNFWNHSRKLPGGYWTGTTGMPPVDSAIQSALQYGYAHHIERLMVLGNIMLLSAIHPDQVYRWFMALFVDAYDWVMVPNVYGMSQFADGGSFATKPYISGSNYIRKMSNHAGGDWEELWTSLYWNFIASHEKYFMSNHRLAMMPRLLQNMQSEKRNSYITRAQRHLLYEA